MDSARRLCWLCCLLWCAAQCASAQKTPLRDALQQNGFTHFVTLAEAAGVTTPGPKAVFTIFVPTNQAIEVFLKQMNLTMQDMQGRPGLAAAVVAYLVLPRVKGRAADVKGYTRAQPLKGISADNTHFLKFYMAPGDQVVIEDVQNNTAQFVTEAIEVGNVTIFGIDKVLLSGDVFLTLEDLLSMHPAFKPLRDMFTQAGLDKEVKAMQGDSSNTLTIFAPTDEAIAAAKPQLSALSRSQLQDVLRYHVVPAALPIPYGLKADRPYPTAFKGHVLKFKYQEAPKKQPTPSRNSSLPTKTQLEEPLQVVGIVPEAGTFGGGSVAGMTSPYVTIDNLFAQRMIIHGINKVLKPNLGSKAPAIPAPAAATAASPAAAGPKAAPQAAAAAAKPGPAAAPAARPTAASAGTGRHLLQFRRGDGPSVVSAGLTATQSSIRAAVAGNKDPFESTQVGVSTAQEASARCWNCLVNQVFG